ncbi:ThiJ/PfpI family protein [Morchella conica CCBAS932]|uniref:D-lactate dehydratase n=1 Tax=Morchella conica CCBAS932 TaxID=1392247 RepID=A0A3N4KGL4_9PEZI|nr:ThiJ/PfpI family protein [Morchella conica CCBAS932]
MSDQKKVLIVLSGCHSIAIQKKDGSKIEQETGYFLKELAQPLQLLLDNDYSVTFATPGGQEPRLDTLSDSSLWFLGNYYELNREKELIKRLDKEISNPRSLSSISDSELSSFSGVFVPGGHGPMGDLGKDPELGRILNHFHKQHKVICHGPIALLSTKLAENGEFAYKDYRVTCYANKEEMTNELMWGAKLETKVEDALREAGAKVEVSTIPLMPNVVRDRELVSGEGPSSAYAFGQEFVKTLREGVVV